VNLKFGILSSFRYTRVYTEKIGLPYFAERIGNAVQAWLAMGYLRENFTVLKSFGKMVEKLLFKILPKKILF